VNESEGQGLTGQTESEMIVASLRSQLPDAEMILTLGAAGVIYDGKEGRLRMPAWPVDVVDTTAAGDTFIGYFLAARLSGQNVADSLRLACRAAAITVSRPGALDSIPRLGEVNPPSQNLVPEIG
jgi:ribokinase